MQVLASLCRHRCFRTCWLCPGTHESCPRPTFQVHSSKVPGHRATVFTLVKYAQLEGQTSSIPGCGPWRAHFLRDSITEIRCLAWFTHAYTVFKPHLGDCRLCGWLAHARSHGNIHGAGCSYRSSWRELCLRQKLSLVGCLADHVTTTVSGHHALGLGHPGGRHSHLGGRKREHYF